MPAREQPQRKTAGQIIPSLCGRRVPAQAASGTQQVHGDAEHDIGGQSRFVKLGTVALHGLLEFNPGK